MAKETRTEYLARISAEFPGAYGRIADLLRGWDHVHGATASEADQAEAKNWASPDNAINEGADVSAPEPAEPAVEPEEPASAEQSAQEEQP